LTFFMSMHPMAVVSKLAEVKHFFDSLKFMNPLCKRWRREFSSNELFKMS
jgi:hypothetical protein